MRVGSICYATSQGLGHLALSFYQAGVFDRVLIYEHPHKDRATHTEWYKPEHVKGVISSKPFRGPEVDSFLNDVDVVLFFETPFDWEILRVCKERGVKTVLIPMYEWFPLRPPYQFDLFINPSLLDQQYFPQGIHIPIPVEEDIQWVGRNKAVRFLHNAGHIGSRNHKGTLELLSAMKYVQSNLHLTVRCQNAAGLKRLISAVPEVSRDHRITFVSHEIPRQELFHWSYDVYIAPEKYNGISLPLQEAFASGMAVMTTDRFPMNTWLPKEILIPRSGTQTVQAAKGHLEIEESVVSPEVIARCMDGLYGKSIVEQSVAGAHYRIAHSWQVLKPIYMSALESVL